MLNTVHKFFGLLYKFHLTRYTHEVPDRFWGNVYIFGKYSSRQVQRYTSLPPQLRSKVKNRGVNFWPKFNFLLFARVKLELKLTQWYI